MLKVTDPVGVPAPGTTLLATVAVKDTAWPTPPGLAALTSVVVVPSCLTVSVSEALLPAKLTSPL